jgi:hypothetical protein
MAIFQTPTSTVDALTPRTADKFSDRSVLLAMQDRETSSSDVDESSPSPFSESQHPETGSRLTNEHVNTLVNTGDPSTDGSRIEYDNNDCNKNDEDERDLNGETEQYTHPTSSKSIHSTHTLKEPPRLSSFNGSNRRSMGVRKTVRFYPVMGVQKVSKLDDLVPADEIWYSPDELHNLRLDVKQINRLYKNCSSECVRGLEYCTKQGTRKRSTNYVGAWLAVMDEQTLQDKSGIHDPASIAKAYARVSQEGRNEAHIKGLLDEAFCQEYVHCLPISTKAKEAQENQDWDSLKVCTCCAKEWQKKQQQKRKPLRRLVRRVIANMRKKSVTREATAKQYLSEN